MADYKKPKFDNQATKHRWVGEYDMAKANKVGRMVAKVTGAKRIGTATARATDRAYTNQLKSKFR